MTEFQSIDAGIATTATAALNRHLWYLTEELAPLSLFTDLIADFTKTQIAKELLKTRKKYDEHDALGQPVFPNITTSTKINDLIGPKSWALFQHFQMQWLKKPVIQWTSDSGYLEIRDWLAQLKVVNDLSERNIKMMTDFSVKITNDEEQKQKLFQMVEGHRKSYSRLSKTIIERMQSKSDM